MSRADVAEAVARAWRGAIVLGAVAFGTVFGGADVASAAGDRSKVFTIANYPVEARAQDAVAAKERALSDGQQAALRSLLRRLVPVTHYARVRALKGLKAGDYIEGLAVRSERNSTVEYIASLDFTFQPKAVRELLKRERLPFVEEQAKETLLVVAFLAAKSADGKAAPLAQADGARLWSNAWTGLDLANGLTPLKIEPARKEVHPDTFRSILNGDSGALRIVRSEHRREDVLVAVAEVDANARTWNVALIGDDAAGAINLRRSYRVHGGDYGYVAELAAVVSQGILEGRWKQTRLPAAAPADSVSAAPAVMGEGGAGLERGPRPDGPVEALRVFVEFNSMAQWQGMRRRLMATPGVEALEVGALTSTGATVSLLFPGGGDGLAYALNGQELVMERLGGTWVLRVN